MNSTNNNCTNCGGTGYTICFHCNGTGMRYELDLSCMRFGRIPMHRTVSCRYCSGTGRKKCLFCYNTKKKEKES